MSRCRKAADEGINASGLGSLVSRRSITGDEMLQKSLHVMKSIMRGKFLGSLCSRHWHALALFTFGTD